MHAAPQREPLAGPLIILTALTGVVDALSYLGLGHVFVANMTGNLVFLSFATIGAAGFSPWPSLIAATAFLCGAIAAGRIGQTATDKARLLRASSRMNCCFAVAALLVSLGIPNTAWRIASLTVLLSLMMGSQNATARRLAVPDLTTTVLTLTLTGIAADSRLAGGTNPRLGRRVSSIASMFVGALAGALLLSIRDVPAVLAIVVSLEFAVIVISTRHVRNTEPPACSGDP